MTELKYLQELAQTTLANLFASNNLWLIVIGAFIVLYLAKEGYLTFLGVDLVTSEAIEEILDSDWMWLAIAAAAVCLFKKAQVTL